MTHKVLGRDYLLGSKFYRLFSSALLVTWSYLWVSIIFSVSYLGLPKMAELGPRIVWQLAREFRGHDLT